MTKPIRLDLDSHVYDIVLDEVAQQMDVEVEERVYLRVEAPLEQRVNELVEEALKK